MNIRASEFYKPLLASGTAIMLLLSQSGCQQLPGTAGEQGAAIGGVGGAATGALVGGGHHRLLGALLGGAVGAGGGYLIGANKNRIMGHDTTAAQTSVRNAQEHPATPAMALNAPTADLNGDGFVTMDEVVAMKRAGLSDEQMLQKMQATGQVFELTPEQESYLRNNGVDQYMISEIPQLNRSVRNQLLAQPPGAPNPTGNSYLNQPVPPPPPNNGYSGQTAPPPAGNGYAYPNGSAPPPPPPPNGSYLSQPVPPPPAQAQPPPVPNQ